MSSRAYLLIRADENLDHQQFIRITRELEEMPGVEFVDPVAGSYDLVAMVESVLDVDSAIQRVRGKSWVKEVEVLRILNVFERREYLNRSVL